jgi:hypothetical protein
MPALKFGLAAVRLRELTLNPLSGYDLEGDDLRRHAGQYADLQSVHCRADVERPRKRFHHLYEVSSNHDMFEVGSNPAVREDPRRLGQNLFVGVATGNVGQDELLHVACCRKLSRFRCGEMAVVARHG